MHLPQKRAGKYDSSVLGKMGDKIEVNIQTTMVITNKIGKAINHWYKPKNTLRIIIGF